jgi:hypothetical protein
MSHTKQHSQSEHAVYVRPEVAAGLTKKLFSPSQALMYSWYRPMKDASTQVLIGGGALG